MIIYNDGTYDSLMRKMWDEVFADEKEFTDYYFSDVVSKNKTLVSLDDGNLIGMIHLNPYIISNNGKEEKAYYIVGVAVEKNHRKQGVMKKMLKKALEDMKSWGCRLAFLMPENEKYYEGFGFVKYINCVNVSYNIEELECRFVLNDAISLEELNENSDFLSIAYEIEKNQSLSYDIYTMCKEDYLKDLVKQHASMNGKVVVVKYSGRILGYFSYDLYENVVNIENLRMYSEMKTNVMQALYKCLFCLGYKEMKVTVDKLFYEKYMKIDDDSNLSRYRDAHGYMILDLNGENGNFMKKNVVFDEII